MKIVNKLWGKEYWLTNEDKYCSKILGLRAGTQCSLHYHYVKTETFIVLFGQVSVEYNDKFVILKAGDSIKINPGENHRFRATQDSFTPIKIAGINLIEFDAAILEVSTHHEDSDSYRLEKSRSI